MKYTLTIVLCFCIFIYVSGCSSDISDDKTNDYRAINQLNNDSLPDGIYTMQPISLPSDIGEIENLAYSNGKIFFTATTYIISDIENEFLTIGSSKIYSINTDGTELAQLAGYNPAITIPDGHGKWHYIQGLIIDEEENIWIAENWNLYKFDIPADVDINYANDDVWKYLVITDTGNTVRKLDSNGNELYSLDSEPFIHQQDYYISALTVDNNENIYIGYINPDSNRKLIYVFDNTGNVLLSLSADNVVERFIRLSDDTIAIQIYPYNDENLMALQIISLTTKDYDSLIEVPINGLQIYEDGIFFDFLISDNNSVYGYLLQDNQIIRLLSWFESNVINNGIHNIILTADERLFCINFTQSNLTQNINKELLALKKIPYTELQERKILTLVTIGLPQHVNNTVIEFNKTNREYQIEIRDYSEYNTNDWDAGYTRLITEITTGYLPDLLCLPDIHYADFAKKGLLADIYTFIDFDPEFNRDDFIEEAFKAFEVNDKLYQVFPAFYISTIVGHPSILKAEIGWDVQEMIDIIEANPNADIPIGQELTKLDFLRMAVSFSLNQYINYDTNDISFDTNNFVELLELINRLPVEIHWSDNVYNEHEEMPVNQKILSGRQIALYATITDINSYLNTKALFGGKIAFKGFPTETGIGNMLHTIEGLSIFENSVNKDAAWLFIRTLLDENWQYDNIWWGFETNKAAFNRRIKSIMDNSDVREISLTQEDISSIMSLINTASGIGELNDESLWNIISESSTDYFRNIITAQEAARIIQNRVVNYIAEQS